MAEALSICSPELLSAPKVSSPRKMSSALTARRLHSSAITKPARHAFTRHISNENSVQLLSFIGGWMDAAGYYLLGRVFVSSITGNLIMLAVSISSFDSVLTRGFVSLTFFLSAMLGSTIIIHLRHRMFTPPIIAVILFSFEMLGLVVSLLLGLQWRLELGEDNWQNAIVGSVMSFAMGVQSVTVNGMVQHAPSTTVMTSSLVHLAENASYFLFFLGSPPDAHDAHLWLLKMSVVLKPIILFLIGAALGTVFARLFSLWTIIVPCLLVLLLQVDISTHLMHKQQLLLQNIRQDL